MEVLIDENYCIFSNDRHKYTLSKYNGRDEEGELIRHTNTYHQSFEALFKKYYHRRMRTEEGINSFEDIINKQKEIFEAIKKVAAELEIEVS